jgi:hypothetical protein
MKKIENIYILGIPMLTFLVLQGCYTQLAINKQMIMPEQSVYQSQEKNLSQSESFSDTLQDGEVFQDTIIQQNYWLVDPYNPQFGYDPFFDNISFYHSFHFTYCDSYWYPWRYTPYRPYYLTSYNIGWNYYDPFWYDPFWYNPYGSFAYYPGYYSGYYTGYWYPYWGGYQPVYTGDPIPDKKRDWDRRGADFTGNTIIRPSNSSAGQGNLVSIMDPAETGTRTIERNENGITKPIKRTETDSEIIKTRMNKRDKNENKTQTVKRIYRYTKRLISNSNQSENNNNKKSNNSKNTTVKRNTRSHSNPSTNRSMSRSSVRSNSKSYSTGNSNSRKARGGSTNNRSRK